MARRRYIGLAGVLAAAGVLFGTHLTPLLRIALVGGILVSLVIMISAVLSNSGVKNPSVQEYYTSLESRLGYWLILGNARHCGLWPARTIWPFPISKALRAMEEKLYTRLGLKDGSRVLDAGAGSAIVASFMAEKGLLVDRIDLTPAHVDSAQRTIARRGLHSKVSVQQGDYHELSNFTNGSFDDVYTMETFVHADDPVKVLQNFHRVLRSGGVLVMHEADFSKDSDTLQDVLRLSHCQNTLEQGTYEEMFKQVGFENITIEDLSENVLPLWRLFGCIGGVPYDFVKMLGLQHRFTNLMAGVETYRNWSDGRYASVRAEKP